VLRAVSVKTPCRYVIPTHSNPRGSTMSLARRKALLRLSEQHNFLVPVLQKFYRLSFFQVLADEVYILYRYFICMFVYFQKG
jgi:hypothetical protein